MAANYDGVFIVGAGQTAYEKRTAKSAHRLMWEAAGRALRSATLAKRQVDGWAAISLGMAPDNATTLAEQFGLELRWVYQGVSGGASGVIAVLRAARAIQAGDAEVVLCAAADTFTLDMHLGQERNTGQRDYMKPFGWGGTNGLFALHTRRYMDEYGATREDFGRLAVAQRKNAILNPNALFRTPLSLEDYLAARVIADPIHLYDCVYPCSGGDAVVLASERAARELEVPKVRILGGGELHNHPAAEPLSLAGGWNVFRDEMYRQAGAAPGEMDFAQVYDDYPAMSFLQFEALGLCGEGAAARFVREHDLSVHGDFPVNTGGGQLSAGQAGWSGGMIAVVEAVQQLRGEAGKRQIKCRRGVVSGYGMVAFGRGLSTSAAILARA